MKGEENLAIEKTKKRYRRVLTIAGSDSGGGAGIQADLKTFSALGCYGTSAITALTAQNTQGVSAIFPVPATFVGQQIEAVLSDIGADAIKIGMLGDGQVIETVARILSQFSARNVVLDPVMVAQSGDRLLPNESVHALKGTLIPRAAIITPNLPEAAELLGEPILHPIDMKMIARRLGALGSPYVLLKGGHDNGPESTDVLFHVAENRFWEFSAPRIRTRNAHGTGCTLSSAVAAHLARGCDVPLAVRQAKRYIQGAISAGADYQIGHGHGPVSFFFDQWEADGA